MSSSHHCIPQYIYIIIYDRLMSYDALDRLLRRVIARYEITAQTENEYSADKLKQKDEVELSVVIDHCIQVRSFN